MTKRAARPPTGLYRRGDAYYGDFRRYSEVGGKQEALIPLGSTRATTDPAIAQILYATRLREYKQMRRDGILQGRRRVATLGTYAGEYLTTRKESGKVTDGRLGYAELALDRAINSLGAGRPLHAFGVDDIRAWIRDLRRLRKPNDEPFSEGTIRHHLNVLSNLFRHAQSEQLVAPGFNPVASLMDKPRGRPVEARWLEPHDAALILEAARTYRGKNHEYAYPLIATLLLTGGREAEVLGLELDDVSFDRQTVTFRPNRWRRLKTERSARTVRLWPQLEAIVREYLRGTGRPVGDLLFPSHVGGVGDRMLTDVRKLLDVVGGRAGYPEGAIRSKMFRHTYCSTRLQTTDHGAPVPLFTVSRELGHSSPAMVERVYSHLGTVRHRAEVVEYRIEQHAERLADRLGALRGAGGVALSSGVQVVTDSVTAGECGKVTL